MHGSVSAHWSATEGTAPWRRIGPEQRETFGLQLGWPLAPQGLALSLSLGVKPAAGEAQMGSSLMTEAAEAVVAGRMGTM